MVQRILALVKSNQLGAFTVALVAVVVIITAINSVGYHHADEHYQIIEFANYFLGNTGSDQLPWEFKAQIRPSIQPLIAAGFFKVIYLFGFNDPFILAMLLRISTGLFGIWVYIKFIKAWVNREGEAKGIPILLSLSAFFLWFMPYLLVRFSSENLSSLFFLWGLAHYFSNREKKQLVFVGLLLGLSFAFRFQMGIAVAGFIAWLVIAEHVKISKIVLILFGGLIGLIVLLICDYWFYGAFVFSPWNYLSSNLIEGKAASFGIDPWYMYFEELWVYLTPVGVILSLLGFSVWIYHFKKSPFLWILIPFLLVHSMIGHKEFRFLFPIVFVFPVLLFDLFTRLEKQIGSSKWYYAVIVLLCLVNSIVVIQVAQLSAGTGSTVLMQELHNRHQTKPILIYHMQYGNPYEPWEGGNHANWYHSARRNIETQKLESLENLSAIELNSGKENYLIFRQADLDYLGITINQLAVPLKLVKSSKPEILGTIAVNMGLLNAKDTYYLFKLE